MENETKWDRKERPRAFGIDVFNEEDEMVIFAWLLHCVALRFVVSESFVAFLLLRECGYGI